MKGLFDLQSSDDLFHKLEHDYARVCDNPADAYAAFDFVVTVWHLLGWQYPGKKAKTERDNLCQCYPILRICEHLAVGAKHFMPTNPNLQAVKDSRRDSAWARTFGLPDCGLLGIGRTISSFGLWHFQGYSRRAIEYFASC